MDKNVLRVDLDLHSKKKCIEFLRERLAYCHDIRFLNINVVSSIVLIKKSRYGAKIYLNHDFQEHFIIIFQLILGSDWMKEVNTCLNHYMLKMEYSNRMFDSKRYKEGKIKFAKKIDVTNEIVNYIKDENRNKNYN